MGKKLHSGDCWESLNRGFVTKFWLTTAFLVLFIIMMLITLSIYDTKEYGELVLTGNIPLVHVLAALDILLILGFFIVGVLGNQEQGNRNTPADKLPQIILQRY